MITTIIPVLDQEVRTLDDVQKIAHNLNQLIQDGKEISVVMYETIHKKIETDLDVRDVVLKIP